MPIVYSLKAKEITEQESCFENEKIKVTENLKLEFADIPMLGKTSNMRIQYAFIGTSHYIIATDYGAYYGFKIEMGIDENKVIVNKLYSYTDFPEQYNRFAKFFKYDEDFEKETVEKILIPCISEIKTILDRENLIQAVKDYMEKEIIIKATLIEPTVRMSLKPISAEPKPKFQSINTLKKAGRKNKNYILYNGEKLTSKELANELGVSDVTIYEWIHKGYDTETMKEKAKAVVERGRRSPKINKYEFEGQMLTLKELSELSGLKPSLIYNRITMQGWSIDEAVLTPLNITKSHDTRKK